jgi:hypothetical protein
VQFLHISKAGGTSMCSAARVAGCTTEDWEMSGNCRVRAFGDTPLWTESPVLKDLKGKPFHPFFARKWRGRKQA